MQPDPGSTAYFETPARAERLQLLLHLLRNAGEVIYLRAPGGAGKTLFTHRLVDALDDDYASVWIRGRVDNDVASAAVSQLGLGGDDPLHWPEGILGALGERTLLLVVDDADRLELAALERLAAMHAHGGKLLLLGHGELAGAGGDWDLQFVDLPPFSVEQSTVFLRQRAGAAADRIDNDLAGFMHHSAHGRPGLLLDALDDLLARTQPESGAPGKPDPLLKPWMKWLAGAAGVVLLAGILVNQERINAWFAAKPSPGAGDDPVVATGEDASSTLGGDGPVASEPSTESPDRPARLPGDEPPSDPVLSRPAEPVPTIELPELSREQAESTAETAPAVDPPAAAEEEDPLAAVMRDAQAAAASAGPAPAATRAGDGAKQAGTAAVGDIADALVQDATPALDVEAETPAETAAAPVAGEQAPRAPEPAADVAPAEVVDAKAVREVRPQEPPATATPVQRPARTADGGVDWLKSRDPARYTLQLIGARDRAAVEKYVLEQQVQQPYAIFSRQLNGRPWYSLVAGDYADRDAALAARSRLPGRLARTDIWPRSFASVQENIR